MKIMKPLSRWIVLVAALMMAGALFFPLWRITLDAPQYPEGLEMQIRATGVTGNVEQINELNHYIGMRKITNNEFPEFSILPYFIGGLMLTGIAAFYFNSRRLLYAWAVMIIILGTVGMIDFYQWEYLYGHHLDPAAAIIVPGMSYQPPILGYKQLLNFLAGALPGIGGYCIILPGAAALVIAGYECCLTKVAHSVIQRPVILKKPSHAPAH